jgi:hypothetical protein
VIYSIGPVLAIALTLYALLDAALTDAAAVRNLSKPWWLVLIVVLPVVGAVVWLLGGRPRTARAAGGGRATGRGRTGPSQRPGHGRDAHPAGGRHRAGPGPGWPPANRSRGRPRGPDDDPEFLRRLDERLRGEDDR